MKRSGFTLIELLAVIVILAIIALIATPIILGIITDAREKANERSVELYASAVRNGIAAYQLTGLNAPKSFSDLTIQYDGDVKCTVQELYEDGSFYLEGCNVNNGDKEYSYGTKQSSESACTLDDKDADGKASLSDVVTCGTESFYVMSNENNEITMLSMYNLYVGNYTEYINGTPQEPIPIENPTNKQNELAIGGDGSKTYGTVLFSTRNYWSSTVSSYPAYVYNENANIIYPYVNEYERILKEELKISSARATLISIEQLFQLGCVEESWYYTCDSAPSWVYSTAYFTGSAAHSNGIWMVNYDEVDLYWEEFEYNSNDNTFGVRPVITISTSDLG